MTARRALTWIADDGGRRLAGFRGVADDCTTRAIAIATGTPYRLVYDALTDHARIRNARSRKHDHGSARTGVSTTVIRDYLGALGWTWTPTMSIGSGTTVHLAPGELPDGPVIAFVSRHTVAVIDQHVRDTHDPCRDGTRAVYGYWTPPAGHTLREVTVRTVDPPLCVSVHTSDLDLLARTLAERYSGVAIHAARTDHEVGAVGVHPDTGERFWWAET